MCAFELKFYHHSFLHVLSCFVVQGEEMGFWKKIGKIESFTLWDGFSLGPLFCGLTYHSTQEKQPFLAA